MVPLGDPSDTAVLVNNVASPAVRAAARLAEDDLAELVPGLFWPARLGGQLRQPRDVTVPKHDSAVLFLLHQPFQVVSCDLDWNSPGPGSDDLNGRFRSVYTLGLQVEGPAKATNRQ